MESKQKCSILPSCFSRTYKQIKRITSPVAFCFAKFYPWTCFHGNNIIASFLVSNNENYPSHYQASYLPFQLPILQIKLSFLDFGKGVNSGRKNYRDFESLKKPHFKLTPCGKMGSQ